MKKAKNIIGSIFVMAVMLMLMGTATQSYFSDTETSTGNQFTAGTLDLKIDADPDGAVFDWVDDPDVPTIQSAFGGPINCLKPGDSGTVIVGIMNDGCVDGIADIHIKNVVDLENGYEEPEPEDGEPEGELAESIEIKIYYGDKKGTYGPGEDADDEVTLVAEGTLEDLECQNFYAPATLEGGENDYWVITFEIPTTVGNEIMGDSVTFDIEFSLTQVEGVP